MPIIPVPKEKASEEVKSIYELMEKTYGRMPSFFGSMAHRPAVLKNFLPFYRSVVSEGTIPQRYKELAYLKASTLNGCEYCTRAHVASGKKAGLTDEEIAATPFYHRSNLFDDKDKATLLYRMFTFTRGKGLH